MGSKKVEEAKRVDGAEAHARAGRTCLIRQTIAKLRARDGFIRKRKGNDELAYAPLFTVSRSMLCLLMLLHYCTSTYS